MARLGIFLCFYLHGCERSLNLSGLDPFILLPTMPKERKTIWSELKMNPDPLASQATALTNKLCLGQIDSLEGAQKQDKRKDKVKRKFNAMGHK